jgi:predicted MFS family arabinose efflux permease
VMALYTTIFLGSTAIGGPITGWVAETSGAPATLVASGAIAVAAGLIALRARASAANEDLPTAATAARSS